MTLIRRKSRPPEAFFRRMAVLVAFMAALMLWAGAEAAHAAQSTSQLEKNLAREKKKAEERRKSLRRLTEEERKLNADLAKAEKRILELEKGIARHQEKLLELSLEDNEARKEYDALLKEQAKTEKAQAEALRLLWDVTTKRLVVGSRDMAEWAETDREYNWSRQLYGVLEGYRKELDEREARLVQVLGRREKLSQDMQTRLENVNAEKSALLKDRLAYDRAIAELRRQRGSTEAELNEIMRLVESLNFELSQRGPVDVGKMRGRLRWPVQGKLRLRYAPNATPAVRGLGFAASDREEVRAVARGKVVHNDILRGFGTVLILQHDADYYTLYAFLGSCPLKVGQEVSGNQRIGTVGFYPAINGPGMYFELRFKQKAINPEQWFAS